MTAPKGRTDDSTDQIAPQTTGYVVDRGQTTARWNVVHVERAFSAQPTLGNVLGPACTIHELPLPDVLACGLDPDLVWASDATPDLIHLLRIQFPASQLLATLPRTADSKAVLALLDEGADLVLRDEGVLLAAAALQSMARRRGT